MIEVPFRHYTMPLGLTNTINSLTNNKSIIIKPADKGLGICVVDVIWYIDEANRQLLDHLTYQIITQVPTSESLFNDLKNILKKHDRLNHPDSKYLLQLELNALK
jgi:hypothetical protein